MDYSSLNISNFKKLQIFTNTNQIIICQLPLALAKTAVNDFQWAERWSTGSPMNEAGDSPLSKMALSFSTGT